MLLLRMQIIALGPALSRHNQPADTDKNEAGFWGRCYETMKFGWLTNLLLLTESMGE